MPTAPLRTPGKVPAIKAIASLLAAILVACGAYADDGVYLQVFDPVQRAQIDGALLSIEKYGLDRVVLIPDPKENGGESLETRLELLRIGARQDARLTVPTLTELEKIRKNARTGWAEFWKNHPPVSGKYRPLNDGTARDAALPAPLQGSEILIAGKGAQIPGRRPGIRTVAEPDQTARFKENPSMNEGLLSPEVAAAVRARHLYKHDGARGYYGLPRWLTQQIDREQLLNDRIEDKSTFASIHESDLPRKYYPEERPTFALYNVDVPADEVVMLETGRLPPGLEISLKGKRFVRFFIHPHSKKLFQKALKNYEWKQDYWATPTSSHRSLIAWNPETSDAPFALKTTLDATIGASVRHLSRSQIERAAASSALLNALSIEERASLAKQGILFIDEPVGVYLKEGEVGYAVRALKEPVSGAEFMPMFSLYSKPPGAPVPLAEMIMRSGRDPKEFIETMIIKPVVAQYNVLAWQHGMIGEPHEQNILMEISNGLPTGRFHYRDLAGFSINPSIRASVGKDMSFLPAGIQRESLKSERARPVENAMDYLLRSNFFALTKAMKPYFPEITNSWTEEMFRKHMIAGIEKQTGKKVTNINEWKAAYKNLVRGALCKDLFKPREKL